MPTLHFRDIGGRQQSVRYLTVTRDPSQIAQILYFARQYGIPTIEILKDGVAEEVQVMQEHLSIAKKMAGLTPKYP